MARLVGLVLAPVECLLYCIYPSCVLFVLILPFPHPLRAAEVHSSPKHPCNTFVMVFLISSRFDLAPLFWIRWGFSSLAYLPWKPRHINVSSGNAPTHVRTCGALAWYLSQSCVCLNLALESEAPPKCGHPLGKSVKGQYLTAAPTGIIGHSGGQSFIVSTF